MKKKIECDFTKQLSPQTVAMVLAYLESRPLGEVYALFTDIVTQLTQKDSDGTGISDGFSTAPTGSGNPNGGDHGFPLIPSE